MLTDYVSAIKKCQKKKKKKKRQTEEIESHEKSNETIPKWFPIIAYHFPSNNSPVHDYYQHCRCLLNVQHSSRWQSRNVASNEEKITDQKTSIVCFFFILMANKSPLLVKNHRSRDVCVCFSFPSSEMFAWTHFLHTVLPSTHARFLWIRERERKKHILNKLSFKTDRLNSSSNYSSVCSTNLIFMLRKQERIWYLPKWRGRERERPLTIMIIFNWIHSARVDRERERERRWQKG